MWRRRAGEGGRKRANSSSSSLDDLKRRRLSPLSPSSLGARGATRFIAVDSVGSSSTFYLTYDLKEELHANARTPLKPTAPATPSPKFPSAELAESSRRGRVDDRGYTEG